VNPSYIAAPMSRKAIRELALLIRDVVGLKDKDSFPVIPFLEKGLPQIDEDFVLEIKETAKMKEYGIAYPKDRKIVLREDVYLKAIKDEPRDRFTIAHEIGHYIMHIPERIGLARTNEKPKPYQDPEWQANTFAGELLAPSTAIDGLTINQVAEMYKVSKKVAEIQLRYTRSRAIGA